VTFPFKCRCVISGGKSTQLSYLSKSKDTLIESY
jgi:hypothetical protein